MGLEKKVEVLLSVMEDIGLVEPETIDRETYFEGFRWRFIEEARRQI